MNYELLIALSQVWGILPNAAQGLLPLAASVILGEKGGEDFSAERAKNRKFQVYATQGGQPFHISDYGIWSPPEEAPEGSVAVLHLNGAIMKYDQFCGPSGTSTKADLLLRAEANQNIKGIVLSIDSPGGEARAGFGLAQVIREEITKPIVAFVDDLSASAAYEIAAATDRIVAKSKTTQIGSIGTYITLADYAEYFEKQGIKLIDVYATKSTDKNRPFKEALEGKPEALRAEIDQINEAFLDSIKEFRGEALTSEEKVWGTGKVFMAGKALDIGLIDEIDSFSNTIQSMINL